MLSEFLTLGGYGQFVWPAFIFTFASFTALYMKTKMELDKQEKIYSAEFKEAKTIKIQIEKKKITPETLSGSSI